MYKQTMGKRIGYMALALLLVLMVLVVPANKAQAAEATYDVSLYKGEKAQENWTYPEAPEGKVFAGWYTDETYTTPYTETTGQAYAKFVPAELMGVKKQLNTGASLTSDTINIRFVTAIDSLKLSSVSFEVSTSAGKSWVMKETTAYSSILADGQVLPITPEAAFGDAAEYFVLHSLTGIPKAAYNDTFQVNVTWNTLDGTKVTTAQAHTFTCVELMIEPTAAPENVVLTTTEPYPVWDAEGNQSVCVDVIDMTGAERTLTVSDDGIMPVLGKVYGYDGEKLVYDTNQAYTWRATMTAKDGDTLTVKNSQGELKLSVAEDAWRYMVAVNDGNRLSLNKEGIGGVSINDTTENYSVMYGVGEDGQISWILSRESGYTIYSGLATENDAPAMAAPTFETAPIAIVTKAPYLAEGKYVVDMEDIYGTAHTAVPFNSDDSYAYPKAGLPYLVALDDNGIASFTALTSDIARADQTGAYSGGVLTSKGNASRSYTITTNTKVVFVNVSNETISVTDAFAGGIPSDPGMYNCLLSSGVEAPDTNGGYVSWMIVGNGDVSLWNMYASGAPGWYATYRPTAEPETIVTMTGSMYYKDGGVYVPVMDMTGSERTLKVDGATAVVPVSGKVYQISGNEESGYSFAWAENAVLRDNTVTAGFYRGDCKNAADNTVEVQGKTWTFAEDAVIIGVTRKNINYIDPTTLSTENVTLPSSGNYCAMYGLDEGLHIKWMLVETNNGDSINGVGTAEEGYTAGKLPTFAATAEASKVVLAMDEPYPVWTNGVKSIQVKVTDMTGAERVLTLSDSSVMPTKGKLYGISAGDDTNATLVLDGNDVYTRRARLVANEDGYLTFVAGSGKLMLPLAENAWQKIAANSSNRLTLGDTGIGETTTETGMFNAIYGVDAEGKINWILTDDDGVDSLYNAVPNKAADNTPAMAAPTWETDPIALVTAVQATATGYSATMTDLLGTEHTYPVSASSTMPVANLLYKVTVANGEASFARLTENEVIRAKSAGYTAGTITATSTQYKITANTKILYITRTSGKGILNLAASVPADGVNLINAYNWIMAPASNGYVDWMVVETTNQSIYSFVDSASSSNTDGDSWYVAPTPSAHPATVVAVTGDITGNSVEGYTVTAMDMTGTQRTLKINTSGLLPAVGKVYVISGDDTNGYTFAWGSAESISGLSNSTDYDIYKCTIGGISDGKVTLGGSSLTLAENVVIITVTRKSGNILDASTLTVSDSSSIASISSGSWCALAGRNAVGEITWILIDPSGQTIGNTCNSTVNSGESATGTLPADPE